MDSNFTIENTDSGMVSEPTVTLPVQPQLHLDITLENGAMVADIKKALKMIKGIASVRVSHAENAITPALARKIEKAHKDYNEGKYTECRTEAELEKFLESL